MVTTLWGGPSQAGTAAWPHPVVGLQVSVVQGSLSSQESAGPPVQAPAALQLSVVVQALLSSQGAPLARPPQLVGGAQLTVTVPPEVVTVLGTQVPLASTLTGCGVPGTTK